MKSILSQETIIAVVAMVAFTVAALALLIVAVQPTMNKIEWQEETYSVKSGDTLWEIADKYCPDIVDKREWIAEVQKLNNLHGSALRIGQKLTVLAPKA